MDASAAKVGRGSAPRLQGSPRDRAIKQADSFKALGRNRYSFCRSRVARAATLIHKAAKSESPLCSGPMEVHRAVDRGLGLLLSPARQRRL